MRKKLVAKNPSQRNILVEQSQLEFPGSNSVRNNRNNHTLYLRGSVPNSNSGLMMQPGLDLLSPQGFGKMVKDRSLSITSQDNRDSKGCHNVVGAQYHPQTHQTAKRRPDRVDVRVDDQGFAEALSYRSYQSKSGLKNTIMPDGNSDELIAAETPENYNIRGAK